MKALLATALLVGLAGSTISGMSNEVAELSAETGLPSLSLHPSTDPGNILAIREITLKAGIEPDVFERFVAEEFTPTFEQYVPGVGAFILKGTRGERKDGYAFVLIFDSENTRDFYFPREHGGEASVQGTALELWKPGQQVILDRLMQYVDGISETEGYTDYVVLG